MDRIPKSSGTSRDSQSDSPTSGNQTELSSIGGHEAVEKPHIAYQSPGLQGGREADGRRAVELKIVVDLELAKVIRERALRELVLDPFSDVSTGTYGVSSYYLDTADRDIYHRTELLNGTKYRFRQYRNSPEIYLERKVRRQGIVSKQRYQIPLNELRERNAINIPVWAEVSEFCLAPSCAVHYTRSAFIEADSENPFRVTIDTDLERHQFQTLSCPAPKWSQLMEYVDDLTASSKSQKPTLFPRTPLLLEKAIVEFKFLDSMPKHLIGWLEDYTIAPARFSKYRASVGEYLEKEVI